MAKVPKATKGNQYTGKMIPDSAVANQTKTDVIREAGFTPRQVQRFETLAVHPELVAQAYGLNSHQQRFNFVPFCPDFKNP